MVDEVLQGGFGVLWRDGPVEVGEVAYVLRELAVHESDDVTGDGVRCELAWRGQQAGALLAEGGAVVAVVVPFATYRLVALHEYVRAATHPAVEVLHAQFLARCGPGSEIGQGAEEVSVLAHIEWRAATSRAEFLQHAVVTGLHQNDAVGA